MKGVRASMNFYAVEGITRSIRLTQFRFNVVYTEELSQDPSGGSAALTTSPGRTTVNNTKKPPSGRVNTECRSDRTILQ